MTETAYTKGPWMIKKDRHGEEFEVYPYLDGPPPVGRWSEICTVKDYHGDPEANARLIASAPDLLQAGKHLAVKLAEVYRAAGQSPKDCQAIRDWMEAVSKAEGRS